jgi:phosphate starvation-inducible PhoH-like protein
MRKRLSRKTKIQIERETDHIINKKFSMKRIQPKTENQKNMFDSYYAGKMIAALGSAGSGKTFVAMYLALQEVLDSNEYQQIIIVRSAVQTREQGFMPGSLKEKEAYYETPYIDITNDLFDRGDAYQILKQKGQLKFMTSSFVRGLTFDNSIIIVDECQSMTDHELSSIITRVGESSKIIFCGDTRQDDLATSKNRADVSGLVKFTKVLKSMKEFDIIEFTTADIVRSGLVKSFLIAKELEDA